MQIFMDVVRYASLATLRQHSQSASFCTNNNVEVTGGFPLQRYFINVPSLNISHERSEAGDCLSHVLAGTLLIKQRT